MIGPLIILTLALVTVLGIFNDVWTIGAVSAILGLALVMIAITSPVTTLSLLARLLRPAFITLLVAPAVWMLMQLVPVPHVLANPIWASASAALNERLPSVITIDVGATFLSFTQYGSLVGVALLTTGLAVNRQRAAQIFHILALIATFVSIRQIAASFGEPAVAEQGRSQALVIATMGILLACAMSIQASLKLQRSGLPQRSRTKAVAALTVAILSLLICAAAIVIPPNPVLIIAAVSGAGVLLAIFAIRRWLLGPWGRAGLAAAATIALLAAFGTLPVKKDTDWITAFSAQTEASSERMLLDVPPAGSGAGAFEALLPIYQELGTADTQEPPTAAGVIMIEMGPAFLIGCVIAVLLGAWTLFNRSLSRREDYLYPAMGAGALILLVITAFTNSGILTIGASLFAAVVLGLAFAQSLSGVSRDVTAFSRLADKRERKPSPAGSTTSNRIWARVALLIFGLVMTEQAVWILSAQWYSQGRFRPTEQNTVASDSSRAASIARVRGDLWAESGFAMIAQPMAEPAAWLLPDRIPEPALNAFIRAIHYSPHRGDVWLMLAALVTRYSVPGYDSTALLKMSYYTAPNELRLLPLRLRVALGNNVSDPELRDMIKRDVGLVLSRLPELKPALVAAYRSAPADRKVFAENLISEVDPGYLKTVRPLHP